jgi:hypothetical protein
MDLPIYTTAETEQGREMLRFSMLTCEEQINTKTFAHMKRIRPRRVLIIDEAKQIVGTFPLFVHDGTSRTAKPGDPPGMILNLVTMETVPFVRVDQMWAAHLLLSLTGGQWWTMDSGS